MIIKFKKLNENAVVPTRGTTGSVGYDLFTVEDVQIAPKETVILKTGLSVEIPNEYEVQIRPRSGVSVKTDLIVMLGTIDSDYRGEIGVIVKNIGETVYALEKGYRIAQAVINKCEIVEFELVDELSETKRGSGGFGHTGTDLKSLVNEVLTNG